MATRTRSSSGILPLLIVAGVVVGLIAGGPKLFDKVKSALSSGTETINSGEVHVMVANTADSAARRCTAMQIVNDKRCGGLSVLVVDAARMPFIARNTKLAWESGLPGILTTNRGMQLANRAAACPRNFPKLYGGQCDEYPMASTEEGGVGARTEEVPGRENQCQGGSYGAQYPKDGQQFLVAIASPDLIAPGPFAGTDIAKVQGLC